MATTPTFSVTYWGTRGSFPRVQPPREERAAAIQLVEQMRGFQANDPKAFESELAALISALGDAPRFGNNTTCFEIRHGDACFMVDAGSGIQTWSDKHRSQTMVNTFLLITHTHMDHVCGLPFVDQLYRPENQITVLGSRSALTNLKRMLGGTPEFDNVVFPVSLDQMHGVSDVQEAGPSFNLAGVTVTTFELNHPGGALGYRFEVDGCCIVIATDHEYSEGADEAFAEFAAGADLLYIDGQYTQDEYMGTKGIDGNQGQPRKGWGHGTIEACIATGLKAGVRRLHIGHHEPGRGDAELAALEKRAAEIMSQLEPDTSRQPDLRFARESETIEI